MNSSYIGSYPSITECPPSDKPEYAFIGRSNVGKSSLINMLTQKKSLALVSSNPGKTKMINYFLIDDSWYLVDLPGYGYAVSSKKERAKWKKMTLDYFEKRENLTNVFLLIDANISPQENDLDMLDWFGQNGIPFSIVYTKIDKSKPAQIEQNIEMFESRMYEMWEELPPRFTTSARNQEGRNDILSYIFEINNSL